jgi:hypothetical protein
VAPTARSAAITSSAGASRMSSVSGLNASPQIAIRLPASWPPNRAMILPANARLD